MKCDVLTLFHLYNINIFFQEQTRIYVFMGPRKMLMKFMEQMRIEQLFSEGKYMVIYLEPETILPKENEHFLYHVRKNTVIEAIKL